MLFGKKQNDRPALVDVTPLVADILRRAVAAGASDIHFEPGPATMQIKFRLDGCLTVVETHAAAIGECMVARLKVMGGLLTYRQDIPQEGRLENGLPDGDRIMQARLSTFPTIHGQRAVVRLFFNDDQHSELAQLQLPSVIEERLAWLAQQNQGVLLVSGPAGSGKSTTLAALLRHIQRSCPGKSIVAIEDPVERHIEGVTQIQINTRGELNYPTALRSLLRQDPQVLMVGEIRDAETARIVIEAGLTGHLLLTTMHSGTPSGALLRLLEMGIEPYQVTSSVAAVLNQRLVRCLCEVCRRREADRPIWQPVGCDACLHTGYAGRRVVAELVELDGRLRQAILDKTDADGLEAILLQRGHMNLAQHAETLTRQGITSPAEAQAVVNSMNSPTT